MQSLPSSSTCARLHWTLVLCYLNAFVFNLNQCSFSPDDHYRNRDDFYTGPHQDSATREEWVLRIKGGPEVASLLALQSGYSYSGPVLGFKDTYMWHISNRFKHKKRGMEFAMKPLRSGPKILWADQQKTLRRQKRDLIEISDDFSYEKYFKKLSSEENFTGKRLHRTFNDELWDQEWYLDSRISPEDINQQKLDLNVLAAYRLGITGKGVRVAVLDDGLEYTHEDLRTNYDSEISYDVTDRDSDPIPIYKEPAYSHGTRCAGEIAMEANNGKCGVGVAYEAKIGGIKMLDGIVNDRVEAESLGYRSDLIDIYTASWGPPDDGKSLMAPGRLATEALEKGIREGRNGRGSIYVWASGNGGSKSDDCGCDGYVNSIYTIAIGSASQTGSFPWYGEICPATLATTYSSGNTNQDKMITTTDLNDTCTTSHTGTSASAPLAAGIIALMLQANKNLTWRDVQHLIVYTSYYGPLRDNYGWVRNSAGLWFNPRFGFGLMDAYALVTLSANWTNVSKKSICTVPYSILSRNKIRHGWPKKVRFEAEICKGTSDEVNFLEHVQVEANVEYSFRGALQMHLTSPSGTRVQILGSRHLDDSGEGFINWTFMSVATWGEDPHGIWILEIYDHLGPKNNTGTIGTLKLVLHGTKDCPRCSEKNSYSYNNSDEISRDHWDSSLNGENNLVEEPKILKARSNLNQSTEEREEKKKEEGDQEKEEEKEKEEVEKPEKHDWFIRFLLSKYAYAQIN